MSFLSEIKKLLWVQKAVGKSAAEKTAAAGKELGDELLDKGTDLLGKTKDAAMDVGGDLLSKAGDTFSSAKDFASEITEKAWDKAGPSVEKAGEFAENVGGKVMEKAAPIIDKTANLAEDIGGKILHTSEDVGGVIFEKGGEMMDKTKDIAEDLGSKIFEKGGEFMDKAQEMGGEIKDKADALVDHANKVATGEETMESLTETTRRIGEKLNKETEFSGKLGYDEHKGSMLDEHDDFFSKASKWADGNHSAFSDADTTTPEVEITTPQIDQSAAGELPTLELPQEDPTYGDIHGFDDADGDGDPLIDDAILDEE